MATAQRWKYPFIAGLAFTNKKGMRNLAIRKSVGIAPNFFAPFKTYFFGAGTPVIKMWDGTSWRIVNLT